MSTHVVSQPVHLVLIANVNFVLMDINLIMSLNNAYNAQMIAKNVIYLGNVRSVNLNFITILINKNASLVIFIIVTVKSV